MGKLASCEERFKSAIKGDSQRFSQVILGRPQHRGGRSIDSCGHLRSERRSGPRVGPFQTITSRLKCGQFRLAVRSGCLAGPRRGEGRHGSLAGSGDRVGLGSHAQGNRRRGSRAGIKAHPRASLSPGSAIDLLAKTRGLSNQERTDPDDDAPQGARDEVGGGA